MELLIYVSHGDDLHEKFESRIEVKNLDCSGLDLYRARRKP